MISPWLKSGEVEDRSATFMKGTNSNGRIAKLVIADGSYPSFVGSTPTSYGALYLSIKMPTAIKLDGFGSDTIAINGLSEE